MARWRGTVVPLFLSSLLLAACAEEGGPSAASSGGGDDGGDIVFGQLLGITGDYAAFSPPAIAAAEIAVAEINAAGGVLGREVTFVAEDARSTVDGAIAGYQKIVS